MLLTNIICNYVLLQVLSRFEWLKRSSFFCVCCLQSGCHTSARQGADLSSEGLPSSQSFSYTLPLHALGLELLLHKFVCHRTLRTKSTIKYLFFYASACHQYSYTDWSFQALTQSPMCGKLKRQKKRYLEVLFLLRVWIYHKIWHIPKNQFPVVHVCCLLKWQLLTESHT